MTPTELVLSAPGIVQRRSSLTALQRLLADQPAVAGVIGPGQQPFGVRAVVFYAPSGDAARLLVVLSDPAYSAAAADDVARLQRRLPQLLAQPDLSSADAGWTGDTVLSKAIVDQSRSDLLRVGVVALGVLLLILIIFLRALVAPVLLLLASAAAVAATLGVTLWLFSTVTDISGPTFYAPIAVAVLLLAFGSDYNIFLVDRIWERSEDSPLRTAIVTGGAGASRPIGSAGLALAGSFAMLAIIPLNDFRQFAFTMVLGILLDTYFVRSYLVPAGLALLGKWASWPSRRTGR